jgi:hypothetical protein
MVPRPWNTTTPTTLRSSRDAAHIDGTNLGRFRLLRSADSGRETAVVVDHVAVAAADPLGLLNMRLEPSGRALEGPDEGIWMAGTCGAPGQQPSRLLRAAHNPGRMLQDKNYR